MGKRGPRPNPTNLKLLHGERHQDRINVDEPQPRAAFIEPPEELAPDVAAVWRTTVRELSAMGLAYSSDADTLRCFCEAVATHRKACAVLAKSPILVKGIHGNMVRNPALQIQRDAAATIRNFAQEFGLTPSARSTIRRQEAGASREDNPFSSTGS